MERRERPSPPARLSLAARPSVRRLSSRELEIARLVAEGLKDSTIARKLGLSAATVATYVQRIRSRLQLSSRSDIVGWVTERTTVGYPDAPLRRADPQRVGRPEPTSS
jgi:DNA-binding NarL/FixJ family response regulator